MSETTAMRIPDKIIKGVRFTCERQGKWVSTDGRFVMYAMMQGTQHRAWEAYSLPGDIDGGDLILTEFTLSGLLFNLVKDHYAKGR